MSASDIPHREERFTPLGYLRALLDESTVVDVAEHVQRRTPPGALRAGRDVVKIGRPGWR
jgi:hypothetical protein